MSLTDDLHRDIDTLGLRKSQLFQGGWAAGRLDLITRLGEAKSEGGMLEVLRSARDEARQIAMDGIKDILGDMYSGGDDE